MKRKSLTQGFLLTLITILCISITFGAPPGNYEAPSGGGGGGAYIPTPIFLIQPFTTLTPPIMNDVILHRNLEYKQFYEIPMALAPTLIMLEEYPEPSLAVTLGKPIKTLEGDVYELSATKVLGEDTFAKTIIIARGDLVVDSGAAASYAKSRHLPILLTKPGELPEPTINAINELRPSEIIIAGGPVAVSEEIEAELKDIASVERKWGATRYETAIELANMIKDPSLIVITQGYNPTIDATIISAVYKAPLIYVGSEEVPQSVKDYLVAHKDAKVLYVGVSDGVVAEIKSLMQR